jgi:hypothetical protein
MLCINTRSRRATQLFLQSVHFMHFVSIGTISIFKRRTLTVIKQEADVFEKEPQQNARALNVGIHACMAASLPDKNTWIHTYWNSSNAASYGQ